jgi:hypothetical protein
MIKRISSFFEEHVEKIILIVIGLVCIWLFISRVIFSPDVVEYKFEGKTLKLSPVVIDEYIAKSADDLKILLGRPPSQVGLAYKPQLPVFSKRLDSALEDINYKSISLNFVVPPGDGGTEIAGPYKLPEVGQVENVALGYIRAAAYVPTRAITELNTYDQVPHEVNDIDLVTVQAEFDIAGTYSSFYKCFVDDVDERLADPCLAKPVFAAVNLQRRELTSDGSWSDWSDVLRTKIDQNRQMFEIKEYIESLPPGGLKLQMLKFSDKLVQLELLQPQPYQIASAKEEWFPPSMHKDYLDALKKDASKLKTEPRTTASTTPTTATERRSRGRYDQNINPGVPQQGGNIYDTQTRQGARGPRRGNPTDTTSTTTSPRTRRGPSTRPTDTTIATTTTETEVDKVYAAFDEIAYTETTNLSKMAKPLVFWAFDDSVEQRKSYQYRIRLGIFNPIADKSDKSVILWSNFSTITDTVNVPAKMYFFAKGIKEAEKLATVAVYKYMLGYWYSEDFKVGQGEAIGGIVKTKTETTKPAAAGVRGTGTATTITTAETSVKPQLINYNTGSFMVDIMPVSDWVNQKNNLGLRNYYDMLYSSAGLKIEHMPVSSAYWPEDVKAAYDSITPLLSETKEPFRAWDAGMRFQRSNDMYGGSRNYPRTSVTTPGARLR